MSRIVDCCGDRFWYAQDRGEFLTAVSEIVAIVTIVENDANVIVSASCFTKNVAIRYAIV